MSRGVRGKKKTHKFVLYFIIAENWCFERRDANNIISQQKSMHMDMPGGCLSGALTQHGIVLIFRLLLWFVVVCF